MDYMRKEFRCPNCNEPTDPVASSCYNCGALFQDNEFECPKCHENVDPDMLECPKCGEVLEPEPSVCPKCGKVVKLDATRCDRCGETFWSPLIKPLKEEAEEKPKRKVAAD